MSLFPTVVKVGGSLYDLPDLRDRLRQWLATRAARQVILIPGGGPAADAVRELDQRHDLGEEAAHWLALYALSLNAHFLGELLPGTEVVADLAGCAACWVRGWLPVLDVYRFARDDEGGPQALPHGWRVTSDSLAARVAEAATAEKLVLLKSVTIPPGLSWIEAAGAGYVDEHFARVVARVGPNGHGPFAVECVNLRIWSARHSTVPPGNEPGPGQ